MSYSFSANPEIDIPANEKSERTYAVAIMFWYPDGWCLLADSIRADSKTTAEKTALEQAKTKFPECSGYLKHRVNVSLIKM